jgi:hypothetical protein
MPSYRERLANIGTTPQGSGSYRSFYVRPELLSQAMGQMLFPTDGVVPTELFVDEFWTEECQGVATDGVHWFFSSNGSQIGPGGVSALDPSPQAIYTFDLTTDNTDESIVSTLLFGSIMPLVNLFDISQFAIHHVGPLVALNGKIYVDHWNAIGGQVLVCANSGGVLTWENIIFLESLSKKGDVTTERVGLVGIDPWDGNFYTCFGNKGTADDPIDRLFIHRGSDGKYTNRFVALDPPITDTGFVQGGAVTANGHVYIASGRSGIKPFQHIYCYSLLNGRLLSIIPILSQESNQELEGICYFPLNIDGHDVQLHAVLLENFGASEKDNIFFKSIALNFPSVA